jgi:hypothetical protein
LKKTGLIGVVSKQTDRYLFNMAKQDSSLGSSPSVQAGDPAGEKPKTRLAEGALRDQASDYARENPRTAIAAGAALAAGVIAAAAIPLVRRQSGTGGARKTGAAGNTALIVERDAGNGRAVKVKFGNVTVSGVKPAAATLAAHVQRSTDALERVARTLATPGVVIRPKKDVPQFSAAESERGVFIRRLNGRVERGRLVDGTFKVID